jgi:predicted ester cyclase
MSTTNIELLQRAWTAYDRGDVEAFRECVTDDWRMYGPDGPAGEVGTLEDQVATMELHRVAFPDKHTAINQIVADDTTVACFCTVTATQTGPYLDLAPTGQRVVVHEMMFSRVRDGRLAETWAIDAGPGFYEQITGQLAPEGVDNLG